jgi:TPR repeat protein
MVNDMSDPEAEQLLATLLPKAEEGDADAQYELAWRQALGSVLPLNDEQAVGWLVRAAENGHALAQNNLGARYYAGEGVEKNFIEAFHWFYAAYKQGDRKAGKNLNSLIGELSDEDLARAKLRAGLT